MKAIVRPRAAATPARTAAPLPRFSGSTTTWSAPAVEGGVGGAVGRPVVDDDDLEPAVGRRRSASAARTAATVRADAGRLVEGGDDDGRPHGARGPAAAATRSWSVLAHRLQEHGAVQHEADDGGRRPAATTLARDQRRRRCRSRGRRTAPRSTTTSTSAATDGHADERDRHLHPADERVGAERDTCGAGRRRTTDATAMAVRSASTRIQPSALAQDDEERRRRPRWAPAPRGRGGAGARSRGEVRRGARRRSAVVGGGSGVGARSRGTGGRRGEEDRQADAEQRERVGDPLDRLAPVGAARRARRWAPPPSGSGATR